MAGYSYGAQNIWKRPDVVEALRDALGRKLTGGEAAKELSEKFGVTITRNSAIGKAFREGIAIQGERKNAGWFKPSDKPKKDRPAEKVCVMGRKPIAIAAPVKPIEPPNSRGLPILSLKHRDCRWPTGLGEDGTHLFCGAEVSEATIDRGRCYCGFHISLAYVPTGKINMRPSRPANSTRAWIQG